MRSSLITLLAAGVLFAADVPRPSPPFTIQRPNQAPLTLKQYEGKVVVLAFIHTTCPHCQNLTQLINPIAREYEPKGVQFVECAFNPNAAGLVQMFAQTYQTTFPVGWSDEGSVMSYLDIPIMNAARFYVPHLVFLDRRGVIRGDYAGESEFLKNPVVNIRAELDKILKTAGPPAKKGTTAAARPAHK